MPWNFPAVFPDSIGVTIQSSWLLGVKLRNLDSAIQFPDRRVIAARRAVDPFSRGGDDLRVVYMSLLSTLMCGYIWSLSEFAHGSHESSHNVLHLSSHCALAQGSAQSQAEVAPDEDSLVIVSKIHIVSSTASLLLTSAPPRQTAYNHTTGHQWAYKGVPETLRSATAHCLLLLLPSPQN